MPTRALYDAVSGTVLTAANLDTLAKGWCGYVETTSPATTSGTTPLTLLTLSTPVLASRRLRLTFVCYSVNFSVAGDTFRVHFTYDGAQVGGNILKRSATATEQDYVTLVRIADTTAAGNKTITVVATRTGGTGTLTHDANASNPMYLLIEDIGASS